MSKTQNTTEKSPAQQRIEFNKNAIVTKLREAGIPMIEMQYSGEGDSGNGADITQPLESEKLRVTIKRTTGVYDMDKRAWEISEYEQEMDMDDALQEFLDAIISVHGHDGYENGDGGGGTLTITVESNSYELAHYNNIVEQDFSSYAG